MLRCSTGDTVVTADRMRVRRVLIGDSVVMVDALETQERPERDPRETRERPERDLRET